METTDSEISALRRVMRGVPSPVTIVTARGATEARGATIGSFTSVSLTPPLVSFNVDRNSQMHDVLEEATHFAVHLPSREHAPLCARFAVPDRPGPEQLGPVPHELDGHGIPILKSALAVIKCQTHDTLIAGDHSIIVGEVTRVEQRDQKAPVLYYERTYRTLPQQGTFDERETCLQTAS